jgi:hypothetical protein
MRVSPWTADEHGLYRTIAAAEDDIDGPLPDPGLGMPSWRRLREE